MPYNPNEVNMKRKELNNLRIEIFAKNCDTSVFRENLRNILEDNDIRQTDLAKAIGVDNQTISNWLNDSNGYRPKWVDYMFKMNEFLYARVPKYNPLDLFTKNKEMEQQLFQYFEKTNTDLEHMKKQDLEKYVVALGGANGRLSLAEWKGVDYYTLFKDAKFHQLLEKVNDNYCKVPLGQRINKFSREYLQREMFDYFVNFLEKGNERIAKMKEEKKKKDEIKKS